MVAFATDVVSVPHSVSNESARVALQWIRKLPDEAWQPVNLRSKDRSRIKFSSQRFYGEAESWDTRVPPELLALGDRKSVV